MSKEPITENHLRVSCRVAFVDGFKHARERPSRNVDEACAEALYRYPPPVRPRVVTLGSWDYRFVDGAIQQRIHAHCDVKWREISRDVDLYNALAGLIANPTEPLPEDRES